MKNQSFLRKERGVYPQGLCTGCHVLKSNNIEGKSLWNTKLENRHIHGDLYVLKKTNRLNKKASPCADTSIEHSKPVLPSS